MSKLEIVALSRQAVSCRSCFEDLPLHPARVDIAQPRWIGPEYWTAGVRIAIVMLNPGGGESYSSQTNHDLTSLLRDFSENSVSFNQLLAQQEEDMPNWGRGGKFLKFYL